MAGETPNSTFKVGLTGGIASGKSTVAEYFAELGVPVIDTDVIAREVVEPGKPALDAIRAQFGDDVVTTAGELDRAAMRRLAFSDDQHRRALEAILHPLIGAECRRQSDAAGGPYQLVVVPLLVNSPLLQFVDRVLVVDCDEQVQLERLLARDEGSVEQARRMIAAQSSRDERLAIADDVILNNGALDLLRQEVAALHEKYCAVAAS